MHRIAYLPSAVADIEDAEESLALHSAEAADAFIGAIDQKVANLVDFPFMCPVSGYDPDLRCMTLPYEYLLFYLVEDFMEVIRVYRVLHGSRNIPSVLGRE